MNDPSRIPRILDKLRLLWEKNPNQRLIQLLINAEPIIRNGAHAFSLDDSDLEWAIEHYYDTPDGGN